MEKFPNLAVDMAERISFSQVRNKEKVTEIWKSDRKYFSGEEEMSSPNVNNPFRGLGLGDDILERIYYKNAMKWYVGCF